jgi:hypothetical protein
MQCEITYYTPMRIWAALTCRTVFKKPCHLPDHEHRTFACVSECMPDKQGNMLPGVCSVMAETTVTKRIREQTVRGPSSLRPTSEPSNPNAVTEVAARNLPRTAGQTVPARPEFQTATLPTTDTRPNSKPPSLCPNRSHRCDPNDTDPGCHRDRV